MDMATTPSTKARFPVQKSRRYLPPSQTSQRPLDELVRWSGRSDIDDARLDLLRRAGGDGDVQVYFAGDITLLKRPCVSVVGTREVTEDGRRRALRLGRELTSFGIVVTSGLARGVDAAAHTSAISSGGRTIAVIGTPLDKAYPIENAHLQEEIYTDHLLISPFLIGQRVFKTNFPARNRVMAALSDATVIVEASDTSGTLHQAAECLRIGRWLFIVRHVAEDPRLSWPKKFLSHPRTQVLTDVHQIAERVIR